MAEAAGEGKANPDDLKAEGNKCFRAQEYAKAIEWYTKAISVKETAIYYANRAFCHIHLEDILAALKDANKAIELDPTYLKGYYRRGIANLHLRKYRAALSDFAKVLKGEPGARGARLAARQCQERLKSQAAAFLSAIATEKSLLPSQRIKWAAVSIPSAYDGMRLDEAKGITRDWVMDMISRFKEQKKIAKRYLFYLLFQILETLKKTTTLARVLVPMKKDVVVCGDTHGQFYDTVHIFETEGFPSSETPYVMNGDFVDRGSFSVENVLMLFAFKVLDPLCITLTRGNHESRQLNELYGFGRECQDKYGDDVFDLFLEVFDWLPIAAIINNEVFVVHGGIGFERDDVTLAEIDNIKRPKPIPESGIMCDLLWSDPMKTPGRQPNKRGVSRHFGPDVTESFLATNKLKLIIRSHEMKMQGYEVECGGKLITVFSCPNYCDRAGNKGAYIKLNGSELVPRFTTFDASPHPKARSYSMAWG